MAGASPQKRGPRPQAAGPQGDTGSLYEQIHRRGSGASSWWILALIVAVALHGVVLGVFAGRRFGAVAVKKPTIEIQTDIVEDYRTEPEVIRQVIKMSAHSSPRQRSEGYGRRLARGDVAAPEISVDKLDGSGLAFDLRGRGRKEAGRWRGRSNVKGLTGGVSREGEQDFRSAMDALARPVVQSVKRSKTLVVILFDGSRSLIKERGLLSAQLQRTFDELKFAITDRQEKKLDWAVVAFGEKAKLVLKPTRSIKDVQRALNGMSVDKSGKENVLGAIAFALKKLSRRGRRMVLVLMTDEQGDDVGLAPKAPANVKKALDAAVRACKSKNARVYVLGREAYFQRPGRYYVVKEKGENRVGWQDLGYADCRQEVPRRARHAMVGSSYIPSGFGCYSLSVLAYRTGGAVMIVSDTPSMYKPRDLKPYRPAYDYPDQYDRKAKHTSLRQAIVEAIGKMPDYGWRTLRGKGPWSEQNAHWVKMQAAFAKRLKECEGSIRRLGRLKGKARSAGKRWQANYDLTLATLRKEKAMTIQYLAVIPTLLKRWPKPTNKKKAGQVMTCRLWPERPKGRTVNYPGGARARNAVKQAQNALAGVVRKHPGTPWAACAEEGLRYMWPVKAWAYWGPPKDPPGLKATTL